MTEKQVSKLISENLTAVYGYAFGRLFDKSEVDFLVSDIIYAAVTSAGKIKDPDAFHGFFWRIAENTYHNFLRKKARTAKIGSIYGETGDLQISPQEEYAAKEEAEEEIYLLRRELSLLSKVNREVCIAYYKDGKTCSEIAKETGLSLEMVKYHLFKTRKLLKEGMGMTRKLGEKSYNPGVFRLNFWGDWNHYGEVFNRRLPGAICLAAYYTAMTMQELSIELGVAVPYLEDEVELLEKAGILCREGPKYRTNIVILTDEYDKEFQRKTEAIYPGFAKKAYDGVARILPEIKKMDFYDPRYDDNRLLFSMLNIAFIQAYKKAKTISPISTPPRLTLGGNGWVFGHDNDYKNNHFCGIAMEMWNRDCTAWFSAENYKVIKEAQNFRHTMFRERSETICDIMLGKMPGADNPVIKNLVNEGIVSEASGKYTARFPVFSDNEFRQICELLKPVTDAVCDCMTDISDRAEALLSEHVPPKLKNQCGDIAKIYHRLDVMAILLECLIKDNYLTVPKKKTPLCIFGVKIG